MEIIEIARVLLSDICRVTTIRIRLKNNVNKIN